MQRGASIEGDKDGPTPLHIAAQQSRIRILEHLLNESAAIDSFDESGRAAIHMVSSTGNKPVLDLLLSKNANVNLRERDTLYSALHLAVIEGHLHIAQTILECDCGAPGEPSTKVDLNLRNKDGDTPLIIAANLVRQDMVELLLSNDSDHRANVAIVGSAGCTALIRAVWRRSFEITDLLLNAPRGANNLEHPDKDGWTALFFAVWNRDYPIVKLLLQKKANLWTICDQGESVLLYSMCHKAGSEIIDLLINDAFKERMSSSPLPINAPGHDQKTILHHLIEAGNFDTARTFVKNGAIATIKDNKGDTALHFAARHLQILPELFHAMTETLGVSTTSYNIQNNEGKTALHEAARFQQYAMMDHLLGLGVDVNVKDRADRFPLDYVLEHNNFNIEVEVQKTILRKLVESHGDEEPNAKLFNQRTLLHIAVEYLDSPTLTQSLLNAGASTEAVDGRGNTPLHSALAKLSAVEDFSQAEERKDIPSIILGSQKERTLGVVNNDGFTALYLAASVGHVTIVEKLLDHGADPNGPDEENLALYIAIKRQHSGVIDALLKSPSLRLDIRNKRGDSPLLFAVSEGNRYAVETLLDSKLNFEDSTETALQRAASIGSSPLVSLILGKYDDLRRYSKDSGTMHERSHPLLLGALHKEVVRIFLSSGLVPDVNSIRSSQTGATVLHQAARGSLGSVELLLDAQADVNARDFYDKTPLHYTAAYGIYSQEAEMATALLDKGAELEAEDAFGRTPLQLLVLEWAPYADITPLMQTLILRGADWRRINRTVINNPRVSSNSLECFLTFSKGEGLDSRYESSKQTPLHIFRDPERIKIICRYRTGSRSRSMVTEFYGNPLTFAMDLEDKGRIRALLKTPDTDESIGNEDREHHTSSSAAKKDVKLSLNLESLIQYSAINFGILQGPYSMFKLLFQLQRNLITTHDERGLSLVHLAALWGN